MALAALDWLKRKNIKKTKKKKHYSTFDFPNVHIGEKREEDAIYIGYSRLRIIQMRMLLVI